MSTSVEVTGLKATPETGAVKLTWGVSSTSYLIGFDILVEQSGKVVERISALPATAREETIPLTGTGHKFTVRAVVEVGGKTVSADPTPAPPPPPAEPPAPVLSVSGQVVSWPAIPGVSQYEFATVLNPGTTRETTYEVLQGTTIQPAAVPGQTVNYGCRAYAPPSENWAKEVSISYAATPTPPAPPIEPSPPTEPGKQIVGADINGWSGIFAQMAAAGIKHFRSGTTAHIAEAAQHGVTPATIIFGEGGSIGGIVPATYAANVKAEVLKYALTAVEVLNEPGGSWFWSDPTNYTAYTALLKATHEALKGTGCKVLASWDGGSVENPPSRFGPGVKKAGGYAYCDGVTVHPYGGEKGQAGGANGNRPMIEAAHKETGLPVYITEVGFPTGTGADGDSQAWTEAQQAANITSLGEWCEQQSYVAMLIIYNLINAEDSGTNQYGVWRHTLVEKPGSAALAALATS